MTSAERTAAMGLKVLLVDDSETVRRIVSLMLQQAGHKPIQAANGLEAVEKLACHSIDLVISDLNMPKMDGIEFVRKLRQTPGLEQMPFIMLTTQAHERLSAIEAGADMFIAKPVTPEALVGALEKVYNDKRSSRPVGSEVEK